MRIDSRESILLCSFDFSESIQSLSSTINSDHALTPEANDCHALT